MRDIRCRGKSIETGEWIIGFYGMHYEKQKVDGIIKIMDVHVIYDDKGMPRRIVPETRGSVTGIKDSKQNEIFEGDILNFPCHCLLESMLELAIVEYYINRRISEFRLTNNKGKHYYYHPKRNIEEDGIVIGNIHDNPELLEIDKYW